MQEDCLEAIDTGQRRHRWPGFGGQVGRRERMSKWIDLECVLEMILLGLTEGLQMRGKATQDVGFKQLGE